MQLPKWAIALLAILGAFPSSPAEEVLRTPPAIYEEKLAPLLTPLDVALEKRKVFTSKDGTGSVLLDEEIDYVDEAGRIYIVEHRVFQALTEDGCKQIAKDSAHFRRADEKIYLVLAQTILPDGTKIPVQPNAVFISSPQEREDGGLYDDGTELIVMFPQIRVGAITEEITLTERAQSRIPGEYSRRYSWMNGWPRVGTRRVVNLPNTLAERLKIVTLGPNVPASEKTTPSKGRTMFTWNMGKQPALQWEKNMPPTFQSGPYTWVTTIPDWNAIARWYAELLSGRETLNAEVKAQVDEWTKDAKSSREIIEILTERVSRDIRYVGLEFGLAGYQPTDCNAVWANRYGDCKDKANLLRAMLAHKGIPAKLVFLDTSHLGQVEKRAPDYRQFDHVILTAEYEPGKWLFCDPTIDFGFAGLISPADADREVMLLNGGKVEWARTPKAEGGSLTYQFDLKCDDKGDVSGWLNFTAEGYYATGYHADYLGKDHDEVVRGISEIVRDLYPTAEIMDVELMLSESRADKFRFKAYLVDDSGNGGVSSTFALPFSGSFLPDLDEDVPRRTPYFMWRDKIEMRARIEFPTGIKPQSQPPPLHVGTSGLAAEAAWANQGNIVEGHATISVKESLVKPADFPAFRNTVRSIESWIDQPLVLGKSPEGEPQSLPTKTGDDVSLENFPMMATAEGQRSLLDAKFPSNKKPGLRRKALAKIVQYFPNDKETQFYASVHTALLDYDEDKDKPGSTAALEKLIDSYRSSLGQNWILWAQYWLAFQYLESEEKAKAWEIYKVVAREEAVSDYRKAWASFYAAELADGSHPDEQIAFLKEGIKLDTNALSKQLPKLAELLLKSGKADSLKESISQVASFKTENGDQGLAALAKLTARLPADQAAAVQGLVAESGAMESEAVTTALRQARSQARWMSTWSELQNKLRDHLAQHPFETKEKLEIKTREQTAEAIDKALDASQQEIVVALTLALLTKFEPDESFPEILWKACARVEWLEKLNGADSTDGLLSFLLDLGSQIPRNNDGYYEAQVVRARVLERGGDFAGSAAVLGALLKEPEFPKDYTISVRSNLGSTLEKQGKYEEALKAYLPLEDRAEEFASACTALTQAVFIELYLGKSSEAIALLQKLDKVPREVAEKSTYSLQLAEMCQLSRTPEEAKRYWNETAVWWKRWEALSPKLSPDGKPAQLLAVPVIEDLTVVGRNIGAAVRNRDSSSFLKNWNILISAARWDPAMALEAASVQESVISLNSGATKETMKFVAEMLLAPKFTGMEERRKKLLLTICYLDEPRPEKAMEIIRPFLANDTNKDEIYFAMQRMHGAAAWGIPAERGPAIKSLEEGLKNNDSNVSRVYAVRVLARLYALENRMADEQALLKRELENPDVKEADNISDLQDRYRALTQGKTSDSDFSLFLKEWLAANRPDWFGYAKPETADTTNLADVSTVIASPEKFFGPVESLKFLLLAAGDEKLPGQDRERAWDGAVMSLYLGTSTNSQAAAFLDSLIDNKKLSEAFRAKWLWMALTDAGCRQQKERFEKLAKNPLSGNFNPTQTKALETLDIMAKADPASIDSIEKAFTEIGRNAMGDMELASIRILFEAALMQGDLEASQRLYDMFKKFTFTHEVTLTNASVSLQLLKQLKEARRFAPLQAALRNVVLKRFSESEIRRPFDYDEVRNPMDSELLRYANGTEIRLYRILKRQIMPGDFEFWSDFARGLDTRSESKLRAELVKAFVEQCPDDLSKAAAVEFSGEMIDMDDAAERTNFFSILAPYRDTGKWPVTAKSIRRVEGYSAYRTGDFKDYEDLTAKMGTTEDPDMIWTEVSIHARQGDIVKLKETLAKVNFDTMLSPGHTAKAIEAFAAAGMEDEADLAREAARKQAYDLVLESWTTPTKRNLSRIFNLMDVLGQPDLLPEKWQNDMKDTIKAPQTRVRLLITIARLKSDWKEVEALAAEATKNFPTYYDYYWDQGDALYRLDRKAEALAPLKTFATYAKNEKEYRRALEMIAEIEANTKSTKAP